MDSAPRPRISTFDLPKPEAGLAEWTSRIQALQRAVDADKEEEQRRLEEEIRVSRLARSRRSGGMQYADSLQLAPDNDPSDTVAGAPSYVPDRQKNQSDALKRLIGDDRTDDPPKLASGLSLRPTVSSSSTTSNSKPEPISLAAFIGGRASGPRLNRPAPQADAHDPTQFEQRTMKDISAPHPVFGSGGVAMPGMARPGAHRVGGTRTSTTTAIRSAEKPIVGSYASIRVGLQSGEIVPASTVSAAKQTQKLTPEPLRSQSSPMASEPSWSRERTKSIPTRADPVTAPVTIEKPNSILRTPSSQGLRARVESFNSSTSTEKVANRTPSTHSSKSNEKIHTPSTPAKPEVVRRPLSEVSVPQAPVNVTATTINTPPTHTRPATTFAPSPTRSASSSPQTITVHGLARPIQSESRSPPAAAVHQVPPSSRPSPAFLKPPAHKDPTPSISRLHGRGFVQSLVKLSNELEGSASSPNITPERAKKSSVFDRWQPTEPPSPSPQAPVIRRANTTEPPSPRDLGMKKPPVKSTSLPESKANDVVFNRVPSRPATPSRVKTDTPLGSSNTLFSYIKPIKTGDAPPTDQQDVVDSFTAGDIDELGVRNRRQSIPRHTESLHIMNASPKGTEQKFEFAPTSGRPLSHPTKERARRPRKGGHQTHEEHTSISAPSSSLSEDSLRESKTEKVVSPVSLIEREVPKRAELSFAVDQMNKPTVSIPEPRGDNIRRLRDTWADQAPIGVKPLRKPPLTSPSPSAGAASWVKPTKHALPGLAAVPAATSPPSPPLTPPLITKTPQLPPSPGKHTRIPSTGSRPTVMEVAQAFSGKAGEPDKSLAGAGPRTTVQTSNDPEQSAAKDWERTVTPAAIKAERHRSNYDKYSSFTLPALKEEKTPVPSPAGTLSKTAAENVIASENTLGAQARVDEVTQAQEIKVNSDLATNVNANEHEPLPRIDIAKLWDSNPHSYTHNPDLRTVSTEVFSISDGVVKSIPNKEFYIFYDAELTAIVQRVKSQKSGLVETKLWAWHGQQLNKNVKNERKLRDFSERYNTSPVYVHHYHEPPEMLTALGRTIAVRQGKRSLWNAENTSMHVARSKGEFIFIDELELVSHSDTFANLIIDRKNQEHKLWVWYGRGSSNGERRAVKKYAESLLSSASTGANRTDLVTPESEKTIVEMEEGQEDEMFWLFLGEDSYASADYWRWKRELALSRPLPRIWKVSGAHKGEEIVEMPGLPPPQDVQSSILVSDLAFEVFILIGAKARQQRREVRIALKFAESLSSHTASSRPFAPPVHVLIFPSRIPLDLGAAIRGFDEHKLHDGKVPDHMNVIPLREALEHVTSLTSFLTSPSHYRSPFFTPQMEQNTWPS